MNAFMMLNTTVFAPIDKASVKTTAAKAGDLCNWRRAHRRSYSRVVMDAGWPIWPHGKILNSRVNGMHPQEAASGGGGCGIPYGISIDFRLESIARSGFCKKAVIDAHRSKHESIA